MARRAFCLIAGCLFLTAGTARGDALPYEADSERAFDATGVLAGLDGFPDHVFVQFPAECISDAGDEDEDQRLVAPAEFTVIVAGKQLASPTWHSPNADMCSVYAIDRRGFDKDVIVALKSMTNKDRRLFFETDPRARVAGEPTKYQVVARGAAETSLKEELRPVMTSDGLELFPARRTWSLRGGKTRVETVPLPAAEPGPAPPTPPAPAPAPVKPTEPAPIAKATEPAPIASPVAPPVPAPITPSVPVVSAAPPTIDQSWLIMVGSFLVFAVLSGFLLLPRRRR